MNRHTAHLLGAAYRRLLRLADAADADTRPGYSLGMPVVTTTPAPVVPPEYDGAYCRGCGQIDECDCDRLFGVEAVPDEPDLAAVQARIEAAGGLVVDLTEWAAESCPSLAAELAAVHTAHSPADL